MSKSNLALKSIYLAIIWLCSQYVLLFAQDRDILFHHITILDGLSQSTVQAIVQDGHGQMWFGTQDGLNKYNGYDFTTYRLNPDDPHSISDQNIRTLYIDSNNRLWIGTQNGGLNMYDNYKGRFIRFLSEDDEQSKTVSDNTIWAILEDHEGLFWIGTGNGLNLMNRERGHFHRIMSDPDDPTSLSHNHITTLYQDNQGVLWVGTANGFNKLDREKGKFHRFKTFRNGGIDQSLGMIRAIYEDREGIFWIGTENHGLFMFDRDHETFTRFVHNPEDSYSISGNSIFSILEDSRQQLWIATGNNGLNIYDRDNGRFFRYQHDPDIRHTINNNGVITLYESVENIVWIGTFAGGVNFHELKTNRFSHYYNEPQNPNSLSHNVVQSIVQSRDGNILIGTDGGGLNRYNPESGTIQRITRSTDGNRTPSANVILDIHENEHGIWLATYGNGIELIPNGYQDIVNYRHDPADPNSLSSDYVFDIFESSDGTLWFSTNWGGVNTLNMETGFFERYMINPDDLEDRSTIRNNDARVVFEDSAGDIWIGTYQSILNRLNTQSGLFTHYNLNDYSNYRASIAQVIYEDRNNTLWLGTRGAGLMYFDRELDKPVTFATRDTGLPSNVIHAIVEDQWGNLWLSTNNGITRIDSESKILTNFSREQGLNQREFNPGAGYLDEAGYIYFGGVNGFSRFHPDSLQADLSSYPILITQLLLYNEPVLPGDDSPLDVHISLADQITLPYHTSMISLEYAALNFSTLKGTRYSYMLEGFDESWIDAGSRRIATYTNLRPGDYLFNVRSANVDGMWGDELASVAIRIIPPFWQRAWFIGFMIILVSITIFWVYRYRIYHIRSQNIHLEKTVRERTSELRKSNEAKKKLFSIISHDLRNYASGFVGFTGLLYDSARDGRLDEVREYSDYLKKTTYEFTDFLKNILDWARAQLNEIQYNPGDLEINSIIKRIVSQSKTLALNKKIEIVTKAEPGLMVYADTEILSIVIYNLLNNAIKFSNEGSKIFLNALLAENGYVKVIIRDEGVGMSQETLRTLMSSDEYTTNRGTAGEKGSGFGFNLSKEFIKKNKGDITISSEEGKGTTVEFTVPTSKGYAISEAS